MDLTNWIIILAVVLLAAGFFCLRTRAGWSLENRTRRRTATRLIAQAVLALWSAMLIVLHGTDGIARHATVPHTTPSMLLLGAMLLIVFGCYWLVRGARLLRPRKLFTVC